MVGSSDTSNEYEYNKTYSYEEYKKIEEKYLLSEKLLQRLLSSQEKQKTCVSRELYHTIAQTLYSILLGLKMTINSDIDDDKLMTYLQRLEKSTDEVLTKVKKMAIDLYPQVIDDIGFIAALVGYVKMLKDDGVYIDLHINGEKELYCSEKEILFFRVCQDVFSFVTKELLVNSIKLVFLSYQETEKKFLFLFNEDVKGIAKEVLEDGLAITYKRLLAWNGKINVYTNNVEEYEWTIEVTIPVN